jgi:hypothetical protein
LYLFCSYDQMWDIRSATTSSRGTLQRRAPLIATLDIHYPVFCLQFVDATGALVVGSTDYKLRVYDFAHFK